MTPSTHRAPCALLCLLLTGCPSEGTPSGDDDSVSSGGELARGEDIPQLRRIGDIAQGHYLFGDVVAELVSVELDHFNVAPDSGPHIQIGRDEAWPAACLTRATHMGEGDLAIELEAGAPVFVIASDAARARVSIAIHSEHSALLDRDRLTTEGCTAAPADGGAQHLGPPPRGDRVCLFGHHETLEEFAGLPVPTGLRLQTVETDGDWALVQANIRGGTVQGWMAAALISDGAGPGQVLWERDILRTARCAFPGRVDGALGTGTVERGSEELPEVRMRPSEVERVMARERAGVEACYEARRAVIGDDEIHIPLEMTVDRDGRVVVSRIGDGGPAGEDLRRCVLDRAERFRFAPPSGGGSVGVRFTFHLRPPAAEGEPTPDGITEE